MTWPEIQKYIAENEVDGRRFCSENGYFCRFLDKKGWCIATSCKRMIEMEEKKEGVKNGVCDK